MSLRSTWPKIFRITALLAILGTIGIWTGTGSRVGWTQTSIVETHHDEITEIDYPVRKDAFIAGVEIPIAGLLAAAFLVGLSQLGRKSSPSVT